jgi:hypothetical protein
MSIFVNDKFDKAKKRSLIVPFLIGCLFLLLILFFGIGEFKIKIKRIFNCYSNEKQRSLTRINIKDKWFIDEYNRVVLFHGINAVRKEFPWIPNTTPVDLTNETQLLNLKKWGFNSVFSFIFIYMNLNLDLLIEN